MVCRSTAGHRLPQAIDELQQAIDELQQAIDELQQSISKLQQAIDELQQAIDELQQARYWSERAFSRYSRAACCRRSIGLHAARLWIQCGRLRLCAGVVYSAVYWCI